MKRLFLVFFVLLAGWLLNAGSSTASSNNGAAGTDFVNNSENGIGCEYISYEVSFKNNVSDPNITGISLNAPSGLNDGSHHHNNASIGNMAYSLGTLLSLQSSVAADFESACYDGTALGLSTSADWPDKLYFYFSGSFTVTFKDGSTASCPFTVGMGDDGKFNWWIEVSGNHKSSPSDGGIYLPCKDGNNCYGALKVQQGSDDHTFSIAAFVPNIPIWATGTGGNPGHPNAQPPVMQNDGNLVIYDNVDPAQEMLWHSGSSDANNSSQELLQMYEGNLCVAYTNGDKTLAVWTSPTSGNGSSFQMQNDGNLVVYDAGNNPIWASNTGGHPGAWWKLDNWDLQIWWKNSAIWATGTGGHPEGAPYTKIMQGDGNLVIYDKNNNPVWASGTSGYNGAWDVFQTDGNYVICWGDSSASVDKP